jgi:hypothetical protein
VNFRSWDKVHESYTTNLGSQLFEIEHENQRPDWQSRVVPEKMLVSALTDEIPYFKGRTHKVVGIDWGFEGQTAMILVDRWKGKLQGEGLQGKTTSELIDMVKRGEFKDDGHLSVLEGFFFSGQGTETAIRKLQEWRKDYGPFVVMADQSHKFNNYDISKAPEVPGSPKRFKISEVGFGKWKDFGYGNLLKYFRNGRIRIYKELVFLIDQLRRLRRGADGKIVKKDDHGPDALMCATLLFVFAEQFPYLASEQDKVDQAKKPGRISLIG